MLIISIYTLNTYIHVHIILYMHVYARRNRDRSLTNDHSLGDHTPAQSEQRCTLVRSSVLLCVNKRYNNKNNNNIYKPHRPHRATRCVVLSLLPGRTGKIIRPKAFHRTCYNNI